MFYLFHPFYWDVLLPTRYIFNWQSVVMSSLCYQSTRREGGSVPQMDMPRHNSVNPRRNAMREREKESFRGGSGP